MSEVSNRGRVLTDLEHYMEATGRQARALDRIEAILGVIPLGQLTPAVQQQVNEAWACAREHRPVLIPRVT